MQKKNEPTAAIRARIMELKAGIRKAHYNYAAVCLAHYPSDECTDLYHKKVDDLNSLLLNAYKELDNCALLDKTYVEFPLTQGVPLVYHSFHNSTK